jgi:predicted  nucleic acid-binding Zn-ribbon protein
LLDGLRELVELSRLDHELAQLEEERSALPARQSACAEERAAAEARLVAAGELVSEAELAQRGAESKAQDQQAELNRLEGQQHQIKSNVAYTALLGEMDRAREAISDAETQILEAMETIEESGASLAALEEQVKRVVERIDREVRDHEARAKTLEVEIDALGRQRGKWAEGIDRILLARYEKIASRRTPAVAIVSAETCQGCRVGIPPQSYIEILKGEQIVTCGSCMRILVDEIQLRGGG